MLLLLRAFVDPKRVAAGRDDVVFPLVLAGKTLHQGEFIARELAGLPAGRDVLHAHRVVAAGADDLCAVVAERYLGHEVSVPRQRVHLQNTKTPQIQNASNALHRGITSPENPIQPLASPSARFMAAHLDSGLDVPDLHEVVVRPADDASAVPRESDGPHQVRVTCQRVHLPPTNLYLKWWPWIMARVSATFISVSGPGEWRGFLSDLWYQEGLT